MTATVGFTGCQTFRFPANPFAGAKLPGARLPIPRLPSLAKLPKPNFGNIANAVRTPAQQAISSSSTAIASSKRQPPPAPSRKFDSTSTDEKLAESLRTKGDTQSDFSVAKNDTSPELTPAQKRFKEALAKQKTQNRDAVAKSNPNPGLWGDYKPDSTPSSSNNLSANNLEDLAKVNRGLYDQYGKLTTGKSSPKLSEPFDPKMFAAKVSASDVTKQDASVAELKSQLEKLKARGSGSSDEFSIPTRTAIEIAGTAPKTESKIAQAEAKLHKGFGGSAQLKPANSYAAQRGTVNIPDPTAPTNVLRASADQIPGLIQATNIEGPGKYSTTSYGGYAENKVNPSELPTGSLLPQSSDDLVENEFVKAKQQPEIPTLTATAKPKKIDLPLPREVSEASRVALAERARAAQAAPKPKITFQNPIQQQPIAMPQQNTPLVPASPALPPATTVANTPAISAPAAVSAFNLPATQSPRVTRNQFFSSPLEASAPLNTPAAPAERVAKAKPKFNLPSILSKPEPATTALPADLVTGDSTYAPGSVVRPQSESLWR